VYSTYRLCYDLAQDNQSWLCPDYPRQLSHHLPCWWHPLEFLRRGWARVLPLHAL
jgi:hypothetical protein